MTIIIAPDKFKGSLSTFEAGEAIARGIRQALPSADIIILPMADGGDGFSEVMAHYQHASMISCASTDPLGRAIETSYAWDEINKQAIIGIAAASGLVLLKNEERNPTQTSTLGTGMLIADAIRRGATEIILGLGGSATNDAGLGILSALGFEARDGEGKKLQASGAALGLLASIVPPASVPTVRFSIASDVRNKLFGPEGAAYVYAPQKGADPQMVEQLDQGLRNFARICEEMSGKIIAELPGTGAAGGVAAGLMTFFPTSINSGIHLIMKAAGIEEKLKHADLLVTGEGKLDRQSGQGKLVGELAALAKKMGTKCIAICGAVELSETELAELGISAAFALDDGVTDTDKLMKDAAVLLEDKVVSAFFFTT